MRTQHWQEFAYGKEEALTCTFVVRVGGDAVSVVNWEKNNPEHEGPFPIVFAIQIEKIDMLTWVSRDVCVSTHRKQ